MFLPEYYQKCTCNKTFNTNTSPDLRPANDTCGGVKLVKWDPNPPQLGVKRIKSKQNEKQ